MKFFDTLHHFPIYLWDMRGMGNYLYCIDCPEKQNIIK